MDGETGRGADRLEPVNHGIAPRRKKGEGEGGPDVERKVVEPRALLKMGDAEAWMLFGSWARLK